MAQCSIQVPDTFCDQLAADMHVHLYEVPSDAPTNVIDRSQSYRVVVHIEMSAQIKKLICGKWCVSISAEGIGTAGERKDVKIIDMNNCSDEMDEAVFNLDGSWFTPGSDDTPPVATKSCGDVYNLVVTVVALDSCEQKPMGIAGFCTIGPVMVFG